MAYTDVWDVTMPLDTQAASQGAADFRQTKLDVMQRIASFGAGPFAGRPTPEITSSTANWTGVMYWSTDTFEVDYWSGTAWVMINQVIAGAVGASYIFTNAAPFTAPVDTTLDQVYIGNVNGQLLGGGAGIRTTFLITCTVTAPIAVSYSFGGTNVFTFNITNSGIYLVEIYTMNAGLTNSQIHIGRLTVSGSISFLVNQETAIDTTVTQTVLVQVQKTNAGDTMAFSGGFCKLM